VEVKYQHGFSPALQAQLKKVAVSPALQAQLKKMSAAVTYAATRPASQMAPPISREITQAMLEEHAAPIRTQRAVEELVQEARAGRRLARLALGCSAAGVFVALATLLFVVLHG
jgi:hypothetical protein